MFSFASPSKPIWSMSSAWLSPTKTLDVFELIHNSLNHPESQLHQLQFDQKKSDISCEDVLGSPTPEESSKTFRTPC
jgi:hypothetical protein